MKNPALNRYRHSWLFPTPAGPDSFVKMQIRLGILAVEILLVLHPVSLGCLDCSTIQLVREDTRQIDYP